MEENKEVVEETTEQPIQEVKEEKQPRDKKGRFKSADDDNVIKVNFGDPNMEIKRDDPERKKSFRARHQCDTNPGPKTKARYWSCKAWE